MTDSFDIEDFWITAVTGSRDIERIDYKEWVEKKRDWFKREFPQVFQLKEALTKENIEADYPELLFKSGILWQFAYPQASDYQITVIFFDSLLKAASGYGFNEQWLWDNIPSSKALQKINQNIFIGQNALKEWQKKFEQLTKAIKSPDADLLLYSLHAAAYLENTRTLAWLYITYEKTGFTPESKSEILPLLQTEVNTAIKLKEQIIRLFTSSEIELCQESYESLDKVSRSLTEIMEIEDKSLNYRAYKE